MTCLAIGELPWLEAGEESGWTLPPAALGMWDLAGRGAIDSARRGEPRGPALMLFAEPPRGLPVDLICTEDPREARPNASMLDTWERRLGFRPRGQTVADLLWDQWTRGADPAGVDRHGPFVPQFGGKQELRLGPLVWQRPRFAWGADPEHTDRLRGMVRRDLAAARVEGLEGRLRGCGGVDLQGHQRCAAWWAHKFGGADPARMAAWWDAERPATWPQREGLVEHHTLISESFNQGNSTTLGPDLTWAEIVGDMQTVSSQCNQVAAATASQARAEVDLAGPDHLVELDVIQQGDSAGAGTFAVGRKDSTATITQYQAGLLDTGAGSKVRLQRAVNGTFTGLITDVSVTVSLPQRIRLICSGSWIALWWNGVLVGGTIDGNITGGTRTGIRMGAGTSVVKIVDNFLAGDAARSQTLPMLGVGG